MQKNVITFLSKRDRLDPTSSEEEHEDVFKNATG